MIKQISAKKQQYLIKSAVIKRKDNKWILRTRDDTKTLGIHSSKEKAIKQEQAIQIAKQQCKKAAILGIPDQTDYGDPTQEMSADDIADFALQRHVTRRNPSRPHFDLRLHVPNKTRGAYSWAIPSAKLPEPGQRRLAPQTQIHTPGYMGFSGIIGKGYGEGIVELANKGKALITSVTEDTISFTITDGRVPMRYTLVKPEKSGRNWLLLRKVLPGAVEGVGDKPVIKAIKADSLHEAMSSAEDIQAKIDGASLLYELGPKGIEAQSVRKSVTGDPIIHTERMGLAGIKVPKELQGTILRGEAFGVKDNKAIPFQTVSGLLNTEPIKSIEKQRADKINMLNAIFDVVKYKGQQAPESYLTKKEILEEVANKLGNKFILPPSVKGKRDGIKLLNDITTGKEPLTGEGLILRMPTGKTLKYKIRPENTVYFAGIYPGTGKRKNAGGILYSLTPGGKPIGRVGTGFKEIDLRDIIKNQKDYLNKPFRLGHQGQFDTSELFRAPSFLGWETDVDTFKKAAMSPVIAAIMTAMNIPHIKAAQSTNNVARTSNVIPKTPEQDISKLVNYVVGSFDGHSSDSYRDNVRKLLLGTAATESGYGQHANTYRPNYHGGVMQVDRVGFQDTQNITAHKELPEKYKKIKATFNIDWPTVKWEDLRDPLKSVIAARLYYSNKSAPIPSTREERAQYWKDFYNTHHTNAAGKVQDYLDRSNPDQSMAPTIPAALVAKLAPATSPQLNSPAVVATQASIPGEQEEKQGAITKEIETAAVPIKIIGKDKKEKATLIADIADTSSKRQKGLSKRADLPDNYGMLFTKVGDFWMKDCEIPLDIAFIDKFGMIVDKTTMPVYKRLPDYMQPTYTSKDASAVHALETRANWFDDNNIQLGDMIVVNKD